jgi:hypothetical protein
LVEFGDLARWGRHRAASDGSAAEGWAGFPLLPSEKCDPWRKAC